VINVGVHIYTLDLSAMIGFRFVVETVTLGSIHLYAEFVENRCRAITIILYDSLPGTA
jgi:hypothetical protein